MAAYRLAELARHDLAEIYQYISADNLSAADRVLNTFFQTFGVLAAYPELGAVRPEYTGGELRSFTVGSYVIFYRIADFGVEVARVLHGARDIDSLLS